MVFDCIRIEFVATLNLRCGGWAGGWVEFSFTSWLFSTFWWVCCSKTSFLIGCFWSPFVPCYNHTTQLGNLMFLSKSCIYFQYVKLIFRSFCKYKLVINSYSCLSSPKMFCSLSTFMFQLVELLFFTLLWSL